MPDNPDVERQELVDALATEMREGMKGRRFSLEGMDRADLEFCDLWPTIRSGLELLKTIIKNKFVRWLIGRVIEAGDLVCKPKQ